MILELTNVEMESVGGGWTWEGVAAAATGLSAVAGTAAGIPSPATPALAFTSLAMTGIAIGAAYAASQSNDGNNGERQRNAHVREK